MAYLVMRLSIASSDGTISCSPIPPPSPEKMRFEKYEKGDVWDTYRFRGETVAGREPNNLMVEFRVFNVTKKIEVVIACAKKR